MLIKDTNRIIDTLETVRDKLKELSPDKIESLELNATADSMFELCKYQNTQARAHASGTISFSEAQWLYNAFGREHPNKNKFNKQDLAVRIVAIEWIFALMTRQLKG